jgi:mRNA interferase RelE/StbE
VSDDRFELVISPTARRQLTDRLPESVAFAANEFIIGPLLENPHRVGRRLRPPLDDWHSAHRGTYCLIHRIDTERHLVTVVAVVTEPTPTDQSESQRPHLRVWLCCLAGSVALGASMGDRADSCPVSARRRARIGIRRGMQSTSSGPSGHNST